MDFTVYDVLRLFRNCNALPLLEIEYEQYLLNRDDDISMSHMDFCDLRGVIFVSTKVEDQVINRIEEQQDYERQLNKLRQDRDLLHAAMQDLTPSEYTTIQQHYSSPALPFNKELLDSAMKKLCSYTSKSRASRLEVFQQDYIQDKQQRLDALKEKLSKDQLEINKRKEQIAEIKKNARSFSM